MFVVATFYHFFDFPQYADKRQALLSPLKQYHIKGSVLLAAEGINGTVSGRREAIDAVLAYIRENIVGGEFEHKESLSERQPFGRAKVRLKKETISLGEKISIHARGEYVEPKEWNALIAQPDTILLDARNHYEVHLGTFKGALDPNIKNFKQLPAFVRKNIADKNKTIATFCTGGIRCEKLTAWLKQEGFARVYHLKGGILKYLEEIPPEESAWQGECYVFDERVAVGHGLAPSLTATMCPACGHALTTTDREHALYSEGARCPHCAIKEK